MTSSVMLNEFTSKIGKLLNQQDYLSVEGTQAVMCVRFRSRDLDLNTMTLMYELDLDILMMYRQTKNEVF